VNASLRAWGFLVALTLRRQLVSRKTLLVLLFIAAIAVLVVAIGAVSPFKPHEFGKWIVLLLYLTFVVPLSSLAFGTGALGDERDEKTLSYLLTRGLPRSAVYAAKLLGAAPLALVLNLGGLWMLAWLGSLDALTGRQTPGGLFAPFAPAVLWMTLAYVALFQLLGASFRHAAAISVAYVFFIEVFIGRMPGILKRISIQFYGSCLAYANGDHLGVRLTREEARNFLPIGEEASRWTLIAIALALVIAGAALFSRKEYREV
jgi:ABC-2 type transport system permease protein